MSDPYATPQDPYRDDPRYPPPAFGPAEGPLPYGQPSPYGRPPAYGQPPAFEHPYPAAGYPYGGYPPYGYPPPYGFPVYPPARPARPGVVTAAGVLGYVAGGLLSLASLLLFIGAFFVASLTDYYYAADGYSTQFVVDGVVDLLAAGLLIGGSVALGGRRPTGRLTYTVGALIVLADSVYWLVQWAGTTGGAVVFYALLFAGLVVVGVFLAWTNAATAWLAAGADPAAPR